LSTHWPPMYGKAKMISAGADDTNRESTSRFLVLVFEDLHDNNQFYVTVPSGLVLDSWNTIPTCAGGQSAAVVTLTVYTFYIVNRWLPYVKYNLKDVIVSRYHDVHQQFNVRTLRHPLWLRLSRLHTQIKFPSSDFGYQNKSSWYRYLNKRSNLYLLSVATIEMSFDPTKISYVDIYPPIAVARVGGKNFVTSKSYNLTHAPLRFPSLVSWLSNPRERAYPWRWL